MQPVVLLGEGEREGGREGEREGGRKGGRGGEETGRGGEIVCDVVESSEGRGRGGERLVGGCVMNGIASTIVTSTPTNPH